MRGKSIHGKMRQLHWHWPPTKTPRAPLWLLAVMPCSNDHRHNIEIIISIIIVNTLEKNKNNLLKMNCKKKYVCVVVGDSPKKGLPCGGLIDGGGGEGG